MLRTAVLLERDGLSPAVRKERSRAIVAGIMALSGFRAARCVLLTSSFGSEVETGELIVQALAGGKTLLLPRVDKESRMLELYAVADPDSQLARGTYGIAEPGRSAVRRAYGGSDGSGSGVVYADDGFRIGYGGGYYDRLLPCCPQPRRVSPPRSSCSAGPRFRTGSRSEDRWSSPSRASTRRRAETAR
jgi:5-formyltetrahydrofolate cyclo-ligase